MGCSSAVKIQSGLKHVKRPHPAPYRMPSNSQLNQWVLQALTISNKQEQTLHESLYNAIIYKGLALK